MVSIYSESENYWEKYEGNPASIYFGSHNGLFRMIPAKHQIQCWNYDPRRRPWFVAASSGPKEVVLILDISSSMAQSKTQSGRIKIAKEAAKIVIDTLTVSDKIAIVTFSDKATVLTLASNNNMEELIIASDENKEELKDKIDSLEADGTTNFYDAFEEGFGLLNASFTNETFAASGTGCNVAIIFLTDGAIAEIKQGAELQEETEKVINLVQTRIEELEANFTRKATIFAYSLGDESDREVMKQIACNTGGIWTHISDDNKDNLISVMGAYYQWFAAGLGAGEGNENFVAWVEPYIFSSDGKLGTSVSVPVYDRTVYPYVFLGVVGVDIYMDAISKIMKVNATEATDWMKNEWIIRDDECPSIVPTECQLEALRSRGGANATCGRCSRFEDILPMPCSTQTMSVYSNGLWVNVDCKYCDRIYFAIDRSLMKLT